MRMTETPVNEGMTKRFDAVLEKHLLKHKEKLTFDYLELAKGFKAKKREREELGLRLYDIQAKVERQNGIFHSLSKQFIELDAKKGELETDLETTKKTNSEIQELVYDEQAAASNLSRQIDVLNAEVFQLLSAKDSLLSDVKVLDQATSKKSADRKNLEAVKLYQEETINHLGEVIDRLQANIGLHELQIATLNDDITNLKKRQNQVRLEGEAIDMEKKHLIKQWDGAVKVLHKRDETLASLIQNNGDQQLLIENTKREKRICDKSFIQIEDINRELHFKLTHLDSTANNICQELSNSFTQKESLAEDILSCKCQIDRIQSITNNEYKTKKKIIEKGLSVQEKSVQTAVDEVQKLAKALNEQNLNRNWSDMTSQKVLKDLDSIQQDKYTKEKERSNYDQELLNLELQVGEYKDDISKLTDDLKDWGKKLDQSEKNIKDLQCKLQQNNCTIDNKMKLINELQWEINADPRNSVENLAPNSSEIAARSLAKELEEKLRSVDALKQLWLNQQNTLIQMSFEKDQTLEDGKGLESQLIIYRQRNRNIKGSSTDVLKENKVLQQRIENCYREITNLSKCVTEERTQKAVTLNTTLEVEDQLLKSLKDNESALAEKKQLLEQLKSEDPQLREKMHQAEEDHRHWQLKLNEIKKTKDSVSSEYKEGEIRILTDRLHKMKVQYSSLCQHRGLFARELEKSLNRWDTLLTKSGTIATDTRSKDVTAGKTGLCRQIEMLKKKMKSSETEKNSLEMYTHSLVQTKTDVEQHIKEKMSVLDKLKILMKNNLTKFATSSCEKILSFEELVLTQEKLKLYQKAGNDDTQLFSQSGTTLKSEIKIQEEKARKLAQLLDDIENELKTGDWSPSDIFCKLETLKLRLEAFVTFSGITI